ncbi:uncharacterized protein JCM6883_002779 [Sporobolomyces salmoneus]|uniref:uncharacterized protein n=1 Tax=Sporobolomyces salmoneus TaxID=183962 RepID=UPI0031739BC9
MLRTRIGGLTRVRTLHSGPRLLERAPTFTTPTPSPSPPQPPPRSTEQERLAPLPPTNLPVEDYASPLLHTASFFSTLFRYSVYSSVGVVTLALTSLVGVHLYVEHSALALPKSGEVDDSEEWLEETGQGWSGKHLGNGGGTDPRLGLLARAAVRGAWISMNWASGSAASPLSASASHSVTTSKFAPVGPRMIGQEQSMASRGTPVADSGWLMAEQYLVFALRKAQERGISLLEPGDWERQIEKGGVDRAAVELEERLAGLRERIGGRIKLEQAREGWERIYLALAQSPTTDISTKQGKKLVEWEQREKILASRKLGELGARIAELWGKGTEEGKFESERAQDWFVRGLAPVLRNDVGGGTAALVQPSPEEKKHVTPSSSFFGFWSRSHPPSTPDISSPSSPSQPELSHLVSLVSSTSPTSLPPSTSRAVISTLVSLETFLARTASDLPSAQSVQQSALDFAQRLSTSTPASTGTPVEKMLPPTTISQASKLLTSLYLTTRIAALETHLAECTLASLQQQGRAKARTVQSGRETALNAFHLARENVESVLLTLPPPSTPDEDKKELLFSKNLVGVTGKVKELLEEQSKRIRRDAEKVEKIAQGLIKFLEGAKK